MYALSLFFLPCKRIISHTRAFVNRKIKKYSFLYATFFDKPIDNMKRKWYDIYIEILKTPQQKNDIEYGAFAEVFF